MTVSVRSTRDETRLHLESLLSGNRKLASKLADVIHADDDAAAASDAASTAARNSNNNNSNNSEASDGSGGVASPFSCREEVLPHAGRLSAPIQLQSLGIWIDPIDSTAEYIKGVDGVKFRHHGVLVKGIQSAVVLVGIFDRITGEPIIGVICQPFGEKKKRTTTTTTAPAEMTTTAAEPQESATPDSDDATPDAENHVGDETPISEDSQLHLNNNNDDADANGDERNCADDDVVVVDDVNDGAASCWQERYVWGVCYGDIKVHSSGGAPLTSSTSSSYSPHSSFHSAAGGGGGGGGGAAAARQGSKGSQDISSSTSSLIHSTNWNTENKYPSRNSTPACPNDYEFKVGKLGGWGAWWRARVPLSVSLSFVLCLFPPTCMGTKFQNHFSPFEKPEMKTQLNNASSPASAPPTSAPPAASFVIPPPRPLQPQQQQQQQQQQQPTGAGAGAVVSHHPSKLLLIGGTEDSRDSSLLSPFRSDFTIVRAAGAGYKLLCLYDDLAQAYLLTKPTTYRWDTCAPHAILKAKGGNVYNWQKLTEKCREFAAGGGSASGGSGHGGGGSKELLREMVEEGDHRFELKYHLEEIGEVGRKRVGIGRVWGGVYCLGRVGRYVFTPVRRREILTNRLDKSGCTTRRLSVVEFS